MTTSYESHKWDSETALALLTRIKDRAHRLSVEIEAADDPDDPDAVVLFRKRFAELRQFLLEAAAEVEQLGVPPIGTAT
jgi:hypothetical protein